MVGGALLLVASAMVAAQDAPESLLPPGFEDAQPSPTPSPRAPAAPGPDRAAPAPAATPESGTRPTAPREARDVPAPRTPTLPPLGADFDPELVEQLIEKALAVSDRVVAMAQGRLVLEASAAEPDLPHRLELAYFGQEVPTALHG